MTDALETLVRETLGDPRRRLDPDPEHYSQVARRMNALRRRRAARGRSWRRGWQTMVVVVAVTSATGPTRPPIVPVLPLPGQSESASVVTDGVADLAASPAPCSYWSRCG